MKAEADEHRTKGLNTVVAKEARAEGAKCVGRIVVEVAARHPENRGHDEADREEPLERRILVESAGKKPAALHEIVAVFEASQEPRDRLHPIFPVAIQGHDAPRSPRRSRSSTRRAWPCSILDLSAEEGSNPDARQEPWLGRTIGTAPIRDHDVGEPRKLLHAAKLTFQPLAFIPRDHSDAVSGPPAPKLEAVGRYRSRNGIASPMNPGTSSACPTC